MRLLWGISVSKSLTNSVGGRGEGGFNVTNYRVLKFIMFSCVSSYLFSFLEPIAFTIYNLS